MKILLDTHVLILALSAPEKLPLSICEMISNENNDIYLSAASLWEISIKHKKAPSKMPFTANQIRDYCQRAGYLFLSISADSVSTFDTSSFENNNDPFDQMLVSQSITNHMKFVTHDEKIKQFGFDNVEFFK